MRRSSTLDSWCTKRKLDRSPKQTRTASANPLQKQPLGAKAAVHTVEKLSAGLTTKFDPKKVSATSAPDSMRCFKDAVKMLLLVLKCPTR